MTTRLPSSKLGQDKLADVWCKVEKRRLKRLAIDLKQRLNRCAVAIKQGVTGPHLWHLRLLPSAPR
jgi:hypothetical protein